MKQEWRFFQPGEWEREINVRSFIQKNYTPYDGDESFLADAAESTTKLWEQVMELSRQEQAAGGVLDMDTKIISTITSHGPGYLDKEKETIVGFQTDSLLNAPYSLMAASEWQKKHVQIMATR